MIVSAGITSSIHFVVLVASRQVEFSNLAWVPLVLSFNKWPSVVYILDILAWDWFYGLSMLCGALVFKGGRMESAARLAMAVSGVLSIAGLICLPLGNIQLRMIGMIGYAGLAPVVFLLLAIVLGRAGSRFEDEARRLGPQSGPNNGRKNAPEVIKEYSAVIDEARD